MKISARNQFSGKVVDIKEGIVTAEVSIQISNGPTVVSVITKESLSSLGLKIGSEATAVIKSTSVMIMV